MKNYSLFQRYVLRLTTCLALSFILVACTTPPNNGKLDGQWQVMDITRISDGNVAKPKQMYYAFGQKITSLRQVGHNSVIGNMHFVGDSIRIDLPYANAQTADRFGMDSVYTVFAVDDLTKEALVMHGKKYSLRCRKF